MTSEEFRLWIAGYLELSSESYLLPQQVRIIRNHAKLVQIISGKINTTIDEFILGIDNAIEKDSMVKKNILLELYNNLC